VPTQDEWDTYYSRILERNNRIRIFFDDPETGGYAQGKYISKNSDVFKYAIIDGNDTIVGVDESKAV
jgi:hypothetical protein